MLLSGDNSKYYEKLGAPTFVQEYPVLKLSSATFMVNERGRALLCSWTKFYPELILIWKVARLLNGGCVKGL